ncbi:MAG: hypothetical protein HYS13_17080 [Planctomycetia bacterium]|nr:hypothetical protein [Planctomycetia bacterium]
MASVHKITDARCTGDTAPWLPDALRQLEAIRQLRPGWDSRGAAPPNAATVTSAAGLAKALAAAADIARPHIHPTPSGGVQFEWEAGPRYFEIELLDGATAKYYFEDRDARDEAEGTFRGLDWLSAVAGYVRRVGSAS